MAKATFGDLLNSFNSCIGNESLKTYDLWYRTKIKKILKHQVFETYEDAKKWIKKIKIILFQLVEIGNC